MTFDLKSVRLKLTMAANKGKLCNSCLSPYKVRYPNIFSAFI